MPEYTTNMREFMFLVESYTSPIVKEPIIEESIVTSKPDFLEEAKDLVFKLRAYTELNEDGERALGIEEGMLRAADMIDNLIRRHLES